MLDTIHLGLPYLPIDQNVYILGNIRDQNIAITSLLSGTKGNILAARVAI